MARPIETEIKLAASPAALAQLRALPLLAGEDEDDTLVTVYFDTDDARIARRGASLRVRRSGKGVQQTLKLAGAGGASVRRQEWSAALAGEVPERSAFPGRARQVLVRMLGERALRQVAVSRIERTTRRLRRGRSEIELAFDQGTLEAGGRTEVVHEIELELVEGRLADVLALAQALPLGPALRWSVSSKAERCCLLASGQRPAAHHAAPIALSPQMDAARGFQAIAWNCLGQLLANYPLVIASADGEAVHQCRIALRRLRAACGLFRAIVDDAACPVLRAELKAAATGLGPARDGQVLLDRIVAGAGAAGQDSAELAAHLSARRDEGMASAQAFLAAPSFQHLLFEAAIWIEGGEWLARTAGPQQADLAATAADILSRQRRKLRRLAGPVHAMTDAEQHRLRICAKKLRYANEFFASLYRAPALAVRCRTFGKALEQLQDALGELHDRAVSAAARERQFAGLEPIAAARLATQLDEFLAGEARSHRKLVRRADKALVQVTKCPAWWKVQGPS